MQHSIEDLLAIMATLRNPDKGCPWDLKQSFSSIAPYTIEEAYEVSDAIEHGDMTELRNELGDLLFQVVFYAQLGKENNAFDFIDIVDGICRKMLRRHPHVFAGADYSSEEALHAAWESEKERERADNRATGALAGVALALPALMRAAKLQKRAARVGFDWPDTQGVLAKCREEFAEFEAEVAQGNPQAIQEEFGDLVFSLVNLSRHLHIDAEQSLRQANKKFERRFRQMETLFSDSGRDLGQASPEEMDTAWEQVKQQTPAA
ncbi:nucleoside triphosphate pyrophosphohydrolase [Sulfuriflexus mobilis]|uniref:nucleoside triphosphate pyrophosphohydrolase n=1 Tax=Sulfuriflexus mobilis TaxID=1811807 RepID=UPI000F846255|nr:nucleoside triphosphate pyrophosphohydrolase [Sulfuriflexus mobilis]